MTFRLFKFSSLALALSFAIGVVVFSQGNAAGTVSGVVKSAAGQAMPSVLVKANSAEGMTVTVLSQLDGTYTLTGLRPGAYTVIAQRMGHTAEPRSIRVAAADRTGVNFTVSRMPNGTVSKNQLSSFDLHATLPPSKFKALMMGTRERAATGCEICHSFTGLAARDLGKKDLAFWRNGLYLMNSKGYARVPADDIQPLAEYLNAAFGEGSTWEPKLPPEPVEGLGLNIRYESYDLEPHNAMPHTAVPDLKGNVYVAEFGGESLGWVNLTTGEVDSFEIPYHFVTRPHGTGMDLDGNVWLTEQGSGHIAKFDTTTKRFTEYKIPASAHADPNYRPPTPRGAEAGETVAADPRTQPDVSPHTIVADKENNIWFTGRSRSAPHTILRKFDQKTKQFTEVVIKENDPGGLYGVTLDPQTGYVWYAGIGINEVGYVDTATNKVTHFPMLSAKSGPRRIKIAKDGLAWVNQTNTNKLARIDPKTGKVTEWDIPGGDRALHPYPTGIDAKGRIWTQTYRDDRLHMFDPKTEKFTTFLMPDKGNGLRDFFLDKNGVLWAGVFGRNQVIGFKLIE